MNRRNFLTTLFGAALAPIAAAKILSSPLKSSHDMLVGYKGSEYFRTGVINAPYIPLVPTYIPLYYTTVVARKLELKDKWIVETS
jgi:hypothetical protein